ncbi:unnamed protein product [Rhizophagus irregularis]|uniref:Uncharacterized protein n=1 Tax=Rhizophagus irregularis TaxID=588596 RepID=A0A2I1HKQ7_9GLOM|nr:hypothetical protein RhiirA4_482199 [Rhizophagus irregularis]CAB4434574.1 unnamed protein product [Rhizophagus irregularis]
MACINCEEFIKILRAKSCKTCSKEFLYCFCEKLYHKVTKGSIENFKYEYLTCDECDYLGVRCTYCGKLCKIYTSKADCSLFWSCRNHDQCHYYKQQVIHSIKNQIKKYKNIIVINEEILCLLIFRIVDEFEFINILSELFNSNKLSVHTIEEIKKRLSDGNSKIIDIIDSDVLKLNTPSTPNRDSNLNAINVNEMLNLQSLTATSVYDSESLNEKEFKSLRLKVKMLKDDYNMNKEMYRKDKDELNEWQKRMEGETRIKFNNENFIALKQEIVALKTDIDNKFSSLIQTQENYFKLIEPKQEMKVYNNQTHIGGFDYLSRYI